MASKKQMAQLQEHYDTRSAIFETWWNAGARPSIRPQTPPFPEELRELRCGAMTRAGTPCKQKTIYGNGRCKWHGGASTGPTSEAGREQSRINGRKGGRPKKPKSWMLKDVDVSEAKTRHVRWVFKAGAIPDR